MQSILKTLKRLLSIEDNKEDDVLSIHIDNSIRSIMIYLNNPKFTPDDLINNFPNAIIQLAMRQYRAIKDDSMGISSITQGNRSITYADSLSTPYAIDDSIKALLPKPYARLF